MATKNETARKTLTITGRLSFPHIWTPQSVDGGDPRFSANILLDPESKDAKLLQKEIRAIIDEKFEGKLPASKVCLRDGDEKSHDGYEGMLFVSASNKKRPAIVDRDKTPLVEADNKPYAGCQVRAVITLWSQDNKFGKRVNAALEALQFVADGEPFGGGVNTDEFLSDLDEDI